MTTGLLDWGQAGNYNAINDRQVIRAMTGGLFGLVQAPTLAAGSGLTVNIGPWSAIVDCGDGTSAVIGNVSAASIAETAGGASQRTDVLWADINVDGTSQWSLSWLPSPVSGRTGVALGTAVVPASAATAAAMTFAPGSLGMQPAWVNITSFAANCSAGSPIPQARVWPNGLVELRGNINAATNFAASGTQVATLPAAIPYPPTGISRPGVNSFASANNPTRMDISATGNLTFFCAASQITWTSLSGMSYWSTP